MIRFQHAGISGFALILVLSGTLAVGCRSRASNTLNSSDEQVTALSLKQEDTDWRDGDMRSAMSIPDELIYAFAVDKKNHVVTVVTSHSNVVLYDNSKSELKELARFAPDFKAEPSSVRFTEVPGLVYLVCEDLEEKEQLRKSTAQSYWDRYFRLTLLESAKEWHAIPANDPEELVLKAKYRLENNNAHLWNGRENLLLRLSDSLAPCEQSGPGDNLGQSIFLFPQKGIVVHMVKAWALFKWDGTLVESFTTDRLKNGWWLDPTFKDGNFFLNYQIGPSGGQFLMDVRTGELVKQPEQ